MLYDIGFFIFSIFYLPALIFKGKLHRNFLERFGVYDRTKKEALGSSADKIWIQAVSVGEVGACKNLIPLLKERYPDYRIVLSTITKTGNALAKKIFSSYATVIYFPLDFSSIVNKVISLIRPKIYMMLETEIWPNLLEALHRQGIPSIMVNGRISDKSFGRYRLAKPFLKNTLEIIELFCMQSKTDADRIKALGAPEDKVRVTGNMKFDIVITAKAKGSQEIRESLCLKDDEELLVAGSTHRGEEEVIIEVFKKLRRDFPKLKLLIAPRHVERVSEVERITKKAGFEPVNLSSLQLTAYSLKPSSVFVLDTIGQLNDIYSIAALVFIGGSLIRHGGQNPIEPAIFEKAILFGPHMFNFKDIVDIFLRYEAAIQISNEEELLEECRHLLRDNEERIRLGRNAKRVVLENRGASDRNLSMIAGLPNVRQGL